MRSKKPVDFMAGLRSVEEREGVQRRPPPAPAKAAASAAPEEASHASPPWQRSRNGKVAITWWVDPAVRKQIAQIALDHDTTQVKLVTEAVNLLFEKYDKSPIATA